MLSGASRLIISRIAVSCISRSTPASRSVVDVVSDQMSGERGKGLTLLNFESSVEFVRRGNSHNLLRQPSIYAATYQPPLPRPLERDYERKRND